MKTYLEGVIGVVWGGLKLISVAMLFTALLALGYVSCRWIWNLIVSIA